eukprot:6209222-Pleurochrysis_carterae.AAC.1
MSGKLPTSPPLASSADTRNCAKHPNIAGDASSHLIALISCSSRDVRGACGLCDAIAPAPRRQHRLHAPSFTLKAACSIRLKHAETSFLNSPQAL